MSTVHNYLATSRLHRPLISVPIALKRPFLYSMRHIAAYALLLVGGNAAPTAEQVRFRNRIVDSLHELYAFELMSPHASFTLTFFSVLLSTVTQANMFTQIYFQNDIKQVSALVVAAGGESDEAQVAALFANLEGKDIHELLAKGEIDLKAVTSGGGGGAAAAPAGTFSLTFTIPIEEKINLQELYIDIIVQN